MLEPGPGSFRSIIESDKRMTGEDRSKLLIRLSEEFPEDTRFMQEAGEIKGFITSRPGANAVQIGPCMATAVAGPILLSDALNRHGGEQVFIDIPLDNTEVVKLTE